MVQLVLQGIKRATVGAVASYEAEKELLPQEGNHSIVTDWKGKALCIIRTTWLRIFPL